MNAEPAATPTKPLTVIIVPTATPTAHAQLILVPTNTPVNPPTSEPAATPEPVAWVRFSESSTATEGQATGAFTLLSTALPAAPAGSHYDLWLSKDQQPVFHLGSLSAQLPVTFTNSTNQPWLSGYDGALLSLEPDGKPAEQAGPIVFQGTLPATVLDQMRQVVATFAGNPNQQGFLIGAQSQLALAQEHAEMLRTALAAGNLAEGRRHAEHVINIVNGKTGKPFGDLDGDGAVQNPGDGVGVVGYVNGANTVLNRLATATEASAATQQAAKAALVCDANGLTWLSQVVDAAMRIIAADSAGEAQASADALAKLLDQARNGSDVDGKGVVKPVAGQGGLRTAYASALDMGSIALYPVKTAKVTPVSITTAVIAAHDHTAASTVGLEMHDFAFSEPVIIIHAGATVTWVNHGNEQHSATADDGSFDTGLLSPGASASVTFHKPGVYPYYCALHGGSGGQGMAGRVVVQG
ncbi:MAG: plastocyanin/azurin family copper-binding protein [Caldilineaceae bacterium]